jgi:hypothetical protein
MEPEDGDPGKGEGKAKGAAKDIKRPRASRGREYGRWSTICIATATPDINSTKEPRSSYLGAPSLVDSREPNGQKAR